MDQTDTVPIKHVKDKILLPQEIGTVLDKADIRELSGAELQEIIGFMAL